MTREEAKKLLPSWHLSKLCCYSKHALEFYQ